MILRTIQVGNSTYYYLFHSKRNPFRKYIRFLGSRLPQNLALRKKAFSEYIKAHPKPVSNTENVVVLLQKVQQKYGYLAEGELVRIAKTLDIPASDLYGVATFYSQFKLTKPGKYKVCMCRGTACHVKNSIELLKYAEELLQLKTGQTQPSGKFSLEIVNCMGACAKAPVMSINNRVYGELTKEKVKKIISELR